MARSVDGFKTKKKDPLFEHHELIDKLLRQVNMEHYYYDDEFKKTEAGKNRDDSY